MRFWSVLTLGVGIGVAATLFFNVGLKGTNPHGGEPMPTRVDPSPRPPVSSKILVDDRQVGKKNTEKVVVLNRDKVGATDFENQSIARGVVHAMQTRGKIYEDFFRSRGVSEEKIQNLMRYISSIYEARLELQFSTSQLTRIRNDYGRELNIALGPLVSDYQLTEMDSKAQVEMTQLNAFLKQRHFDLEPAEASVISKLIRDHGAYTYMTTVDVGGVFDDWRPASSGGEAAAVYSVYAEDLRDKSTVLLTAAEKENLSANAQKILHEYYAAGVDYYAQVVRKNEASRVPDPERRVPLRLRANAAAEDARLEKLARPR